MPEAVRPEATEQEAPPATDVDGCARLALRFARRLLPQDRVEAEDVAQDVLEVFTRKSHAVPPDRVRGWIWQTVWRFVARRKRSYKRGLSATEKLKRLMSPSIARPESELTDLRSDLRRALVELPPQQRNVTWLWLQDRSYKEIALCLGITLQTVKDHLKKAFRALSAAMGGQ